MNSILPNAPLIVTLRLNKQAQDYFDGLRKEYFPAHLNYLAAHVTLFHQLPAIERIADELKAVTNRSPFRIEVTEPYHTGFGVAFSIRSQELHQIHTHLQETFKAHLIAQDWRRFRPHITVQNKVSPEESKQLVKILQAGFTPFTAEAVGLDSWLYLNGPWQHRDLFCFLKEGYPGVKSDTPGYM